MQSVVQDIGADASSCGYCKSKKGNRTHGVWAYKLTAAVYESMLLRGWRRCGHYMYRPLPGSCCRLYTIRLEATRYETSKSKKKVCRRLVAHVDASEDAGKGKDDAGEGKGKGKGEDAPTGKRKGPKSKRKTEATWDAAVHVDGFEGRTHVLSSKFVRARVTDEAFQVYTRYQEPVHKDAPGKNTVDSYKRFLVDSCLEKEDAPAGSSLPGLGTYHNEVRLDGELVWVGVLDILPQGLSSVYLFYDPAKFEWLSPGVLSALREIEFVRHAQQTTDAFRWYYMGYWIPSCPKMRYKGDYRPSELLCPTSLAWFALADVEAGIDAARDGGRSLDDLRQLAVDGATEAGPPSGTPVPEDEAQLKALVVGKTPLRVGQQQLTFGQLLRAFPLAAPVVERLVAKMCAYWRDIGVDVASRAHFVINRFPTDSDSSDDDAT